jgi:hypothetical protein
MIVAAHHVAAVDARDRPADPERAGRVSGPRVEPPGHDADGDAGRSKRAEGAHVALVRFPVVIEQGAVEIDGEEARVRRGGTTTTHRFQKLP